MYKYEIWYDHCCLHEEDGFESEQEAHEEAIDYVNYILDESETNNDFEIIVEEE